jgi:hypothetical protein
MAGPRLITARLIRLNRSSELKARGRIIAAAGFGVLIGLMGAKRDWVAQALTWLRPHSLVCGGLAAVLSAIQIARRRALKRAEFARSWLAALPIPLLRARWEALIIETLPATAALAVLTAVGSGAGLVLGFAEGRPGGALFAVWASLSVGIAIGAVVGYAMPGPKPVHLPPGSRYVPHRNTRQDHNTKRVAKIRSSFGALGLWPVRQMFAWAQPKMVARATVLVLLMMPLGTTADVAMDAIALFGVNGALVLLCMAAIQLSRTIHRWMAPLPARAGVVTRAFLLPTFGIMAGASAAESLLLVVSGVSYRSAAAAGLGTAIVGCLATFSGVLLYRARVRRMP